MKKLKVLIVDDQKLFGDSLKTVLTGHKEIIEDVTIVMNGESDLQTVFIDEAKVIKA